MMHGSGADTDRGQDAPAWTDGRSPAAGAGLSGKGPETGGVFRASGPAEAVLYFF